MIQIRHKASLPKLSKSVRRDALRYAMKAGGAHYKSNFLLLKFTHAALKRYGLKPRSGQRGSGRKYKGSYVEAKVERKPMFDFGDGATPIGENKPFVWSGETRNRVRSQSRVEAKASSSERGYFQVIANANQLNRAGTGKRINLVEEFERVAPVETRECEKVEAKAYDRFIQRHAARAN